MNTICICLPVIFAPSRIFATYNQVQLHYCLMETFH